jgi:hypothetical protein
MGGGDQPTQCGATRFPNTPDTRESAFPKTLIDLTAAPSGESLVGVESAWA